MTSVIHLLLEMSAVDFLAIVGSKTGYTGGHIVAFGIKDNKGVAIASPDMLTVPELVVPRRVRSTACAVSEE